MSTTSTDQRLSDLGRTTAYGSEDWGRAYQKLWNWWHTTYSYAYTEPLAPGYVAAFFSLAHAGFAPEQTQLAIVKICGAFAGRE